MKESKKDLELLGNRRGNFKGFLESLKLADTQAEQGNKNPLLNSLIGKTLLT